MTIRYWGKKRQRNHGNRRFPEIKPQIFSLLTCQRYPWDSMEMDNLQQIVLKHWKAIWG